MNKSLIAVAVAVALSAASTLALADLSAYRANGVDLVYDDDYVPIGESSAGLTWVRDANLYATLVAEDPDLPAKIRAAAPGFTGLARYCTDRVRMQPDGYMGFQCGLAFVEYLNSINYAGANNWRLWSPLNAQSGRPCAGRDCIGGEIGDLFRREGGLSAGQSFSDSATLTGLFDNLLSCTYFADWSQVRGYGFATGASRQVTGGATALGYAWPVRSGYIVDAQPLEARGGTPSIRASIAGQVWLDEDADGGRDAGEAGVSGVTVRLLDAQGQLAGSTTSDTDGGYLLSVVDAGYFTVEVDAATLPAGMTQTFDPDGLEGGGTPDAVALSVADSDMLRGVDFGYNFAGVEDVTAPAAGALGALGDRIWYDANGDGVQQPNEPGIAGVTVRLLHDSNLDGRYGDVGDAAAASVVTGPAGEYRFVGLDASAYVVSVDAGTLPTIYDPQPTHDPDGDGDSTSKPLVLAPGDVYVGADFGYRLGAGAQRGHIAGRVFIDSGADGSDDGVTSDPGLPGVTVRLENAGGVPIATARSGETGAFEFPSMPSGTYSVVVSDTAYVLQDQVQTTDPDATLDRRSSVSVAGIDIADQNFGFAPTGHTQSRGLLGGRVFLDTGDGAGGAPDGQFQSNEAVAGVQVDLYDASGVNSVAASVSNDAGLYLFGNLDPATPYHVRIVTATLPAAGHGLTNTVDPDLAWRMPGDGETQRAGVALDLDFGYQASGAAATVSGSVWLDANADGLLTDGTNGAPDEGASGVANVQILLFEDRDRDTVRTSADRRIASATTAADGGFAFANLPAGSYLVDLDGSDGLLRDYWKSNGPAYGNDNNSQPAPYAVSLSSGASDPTADFGYYRLGGALGNLVWHDPTKTGRQLESAGPIVDLALTLSITYPNGDITTMVTRSGADGSYAFTHLLLDEDHNGAGTSGTGGATPQHIITVQAPDGWERTLVERWPYPKIDSNDNAGTLAIPTQGIVDMTPLPYSMINEEPDAASYDFGFLEAPVNCKLVCDVIAPFGYVDIGDIMQIIRMRSTRVEPGGIGTGDCVADGVIGLNDSTACRAYQDDI